MYPEGDYDDNGLRRNLERLGFGFNRVEGDEHQTFVGVPNVDTPNRISMFTSLRAAGCVLHTPRPRHWVALVPPLSEDDDGVAALLCDSLFPMPFALTADEVQELFAHMASRHMYLGESQLSLLRQEQLAAGWSAFLVTKPNDT